MGHCDWSDETIEELINETKKIHNKLDLILIELRKPK